MWTSNEGHNNGVKVTAVVVTHNRVALLKECISSLMSQSRQVKSIVIVNNSSTDATADFLNDLRGNCDNIIVVQTHRNVGGAGGFALGIQAAMKFENDFLWLLDDDTIPSHNALEMLIESLETTKRRLECRIGFVCSRVLWVDGTVHKMNIPEVSLHCNNVPFDFGESETLVVTSCSFVSVLISTIAITSVGLPYFEYFIWVDDSEYTQRIVRNGFIGLYARQSLVLHKTSTNYTADISSDRCQNVWKYFYQVRNQFHLERTKRSRAEILPFYLWYVFRTLRAALRRKDHRFVYISAAVRGLLAATVFRPRLRKTQETIRY